MQVCPHPLFEDVVHSLTFTASGQPVDEVMLREVQLHGATMSWHPNGQPGAEQRYVDVGLHGIEIRHDQAGRPDAVIARDHGEPDRERTAELGESLGLESPLRDPAERPSANP